MKKLSLYAQYLLNQGIENNRFAENAKLDLLDHIFRDSCQAFKKYLEV